jgi:hypothetical protein
MKARGQGGIKKQVVFTSPFGGPPRIWHENENLPEQMKFVERSLLRLKEHEAAHDRKQKTENSSTVLSFFVSFFL